MTNLGRVRPFAFLASFLLAENERGSIEPGKVADFTLLSADIMEIPEAEILKTRAVMTIIGGEIAWREP